MTHEGKVRIDVGRLIMIPLGVYAVLHNAYIIYRGFNSPEPLRALVVLSQTNAFLLTCFYILMVGAYLVRSTARQTSRSLSANAVAITTTLLPGLLLVVRVDVRPEMIYVLLGTVIAVTGMAFSLYSLFKLGRSFSIIPQSRELVATGPYKYLRHPLYVGEIVAFAGLVIANVSVPTVSIFVMMVAMQTYRAGHEEKILASTFPAYEDYMTRTWRFIPHVF